jgi:exodeoxyribonuclease VII large subunit
MKKIVSVWEVTHRIKACLEEALPRLWISGEISNLSRPRSGHIYFTLKDKRAQIPAVVWRSTAARLRFELEDGLEVLAYGKISVYEAGGKYQLYVDRMEPRGLGALQLAFEKLKAKLHEEGLFDPAKKKPIPRFPSRIGVVTSPSGAAIRDILKVIDRRFPKVSVSLIPVRVQGEGAAGEITEAIDQFNGLPDMDVLIVGRGGGSLEDLWAFNEEIVARAIDRSRIPVISAVGHEIDITIADLVADLRAPTPTAAAELAVPELRKLLETLENSGNRLKINLRDRLARARTHLQALERSYGFNRPRDQLRQLQQRLDDLSLQIGKGIQNRLHGFHESVQREAARLEGLSPLRVLKRGYSLTTRTGEKRPLTTTDDLREGLEIETRLARGGITSTIVKILDGA